MSIRAILFDADGVVQGPSADFPSLLSNVLGIGPDQSDVFLHNVVSPAERRALTGELDFGEELETEFAKYGCVATASQALGVFTAIESFADVSELIRSLRSSGIPCHLASNQAPFRARYMSEVLAYRDLFDQEFYSCDLGYAKPDPEYFREILRRIALPPSEAFFIDDHEENVAAAHEVGLQSAYFSAKEHPNRRESLLSLLSQYRIHWT